MGMPTNQPVYFSIFVVGLGEWKGQRAYNPMRGERILGRHFGYGVIAVRFDFQTVAFET